MATSPANPAEIQDRTKKDHGKPIQAEEATQAEDQGRARQTDQDGKAGDGNK